MRKMKQLLAAGLMMSMIAATSAGTSVFASTPEVVETNESTKTESSKETAPPSSHWQGSRATRP